MITPVILQYKSGIPQKQFAYIRSDRDYTLQIMICMGMTVRILGYRSSDDDTQRGNPYSKDCEEMAQALDIAIAALEELEKKQLESC